MHMLPTSPPPCNSCQIFSEVVEAASEGEVNEGISHETLTGGPIMQATATDEDGGRHAEKGLSINEMGHRMNVECALWGRENASDMVGFWAHNPFSTQ